MLSSSSSIFWFICSRKRWKFELSLLAKRWHFVLLSIVIQLLHSTAANLAYYRHVQADTLRDVGFELIAPIHESARDISEVITLFIIGSVFCFSFLTFLRINPPVYWV